MANNCNYKWRFSTIGGVTRVLIDRGEDLVHLGELDEKLWTVLSCPTSGLEFNQATLDLLDSDKDGKIKVHEVVEAANWLTGIIKDKDSILKGEDVLMLDNIDVDTVNGKRLYNSAKEILLNLEHKDKDSISLAEASDSVAIFAKSKFNGDGVITVNSTDEQELKDIIQACINTVGKVTDRSGVDGINTELVEAFYKACSDYVAWRKSGEENKETEAALACVNALKEKVADYFMRCKLAAFDNGFISALDTSVAQIEAIREKDLAHSEDEISKYPLAKVNVEGLLPLNAGINPAWQGAFSALKTAVLDKLFPAKESLSEAEWTSVLKSFDPYIDWQSKKQGEVVEALGLDCLSKIIEEDRKAALLELIAQDKALEAEAGDIDEVKKLMLLYRYFYSFVKNYVTFSDFYSTDTSVKATFQAGHLFIDRRSCELCIKVTDKPKHLLSAGHSGMYLMYCTCTSKVKNQTMEIAAALTDGEVNGLREGMNAVFYDRNGLDWDATVTKIIDNPISIREAFWSPYRKLSKWINDKVNKMASDKESKMTSNLIAKADTATSAPVAGADAKAPAFDIAKFAGIFAAIGMAIGYISSALVKLGEGVSKLKIWEVPLVVIVAMLVISLPSMFIAWRKLRVRNLAPVLNANGWAINSSLLVNTRFGATLTNLAKVPRVKSFDPYSGKIPAWKIILFWLIVLIIVAAVLWLTNVLAFVGLPSPII